MAKYVCDFETVREAGKNLEKAATDMEASIDTYSSKIESDLEGWESASKVSYMEANETQKEKIKGVNEYATNMSKYIVMVADQIEKLENELSNINI